MIKKPTVEEVKDYMERHNNDEVGQGGNVWTYEDAEYHLLLDDEFATEGVSYAKLAGIVGDMVRFNGITSVDENLFDSLENGEIYYDDEYDEPKEIYQYYAITESGADFLKRNTDEIVFYSEKCDLYIWGITHFGTPWDGVYTDMKRL